MTLTIDLPEDTLAALTERARAEGRPAAELAGEAVAQKYGPGGDSYDALEFPLDAEDEENIRQSLAQVQSGQTVSLDEARTDLKTAFTARYGAARA